MAGCGNHRHTPVDAVAIAVQRYTGMALQRSQWREREVAMGVEAA